VVILSAGLVFSVQAQSIKDLTSKDSEKKSGQTRSRSSSRAATKLNAHNVGIGLGQTFLNSSFGDNGDDKIAIPDIYYTYSASRSFDFLANFHTSSHKQEGREVDTLGLALGIKGRFYQYDNFSPFLVGGFGFYHPKMKRLIGQNFVNSDSKFIFGMHFGLGAELVLNDRVTVGTILHFHDPFSVQQDNQPEVDGSYYKLLLTALYSF
jgi:opacity protein-like surface antigen